MLASKLKKQVLQTSKSLLQTPQSTFSGTFTVSDFLGKQGHLPRVAYVEELS